MKKLLLTLGTVAAVAAPVAAVVACGTTPETTPGTTDGFKLQSSKTETELKAVSQTDLSGKTATELNDLFGFVSGQRITGAVGGTFTWDVNTLTVTSTLKAAGHVVSTKFVVTPKAATAATVAFADSQIGKAVAGTTLFTRDDAGNGYLEVAPKATDLEKEMASLVAINDAPATAGTGYDAFYTFFKRSSTPTPLLDAMVADATNGNANTNYKIDQCIAASGITTDDVKEADFVLIHLKTAVDATKFADQISGKPQQMVFMLSRVAKASLTTGVPFAFLNDKGTTVVQPQHALKVSH